MSVYSNLLFRAPRLLNRAFKNVKTLRSPLNFRLNSSTLTRKAEKKETSEPALPLTYVKPKTFSHQKDKKQDYRALDNLLSKNEPLKMSPFDLRTIVEQIRIERPLSKSGQVLTRPILNKDSRDLFRSNTITEIISSFSISRSPQNLSRSTRRYLHSITKRSLHTSHRSMKNLPPNSAESNSVPIQVSYFVQNSQGASSNPQSHGTSVSSSSVPPPPSSSPSPMILGTMSIPTFAIKVSGPLSLKSSKFWILFYIAWLALGVYFIFLLLRSMSFSGKMLSTPYRPVTNIQVTLDDVKGNYEAKEELKDLIDYLKDPMKYSVLSVKAPKGVLLVGPPGTGKTMLARALAGEAGVPFISTNGSEFEEMFVGVGAKRVRELFKTAKENAPCIVFIDEIDAVGGSRQDLHNRSNMSLNQLLVELDGFTESTGIILMAATNFPGALDEALTRPGRFDRKVYLELPAKEARKEILEYYLRDKGGEDVDIDKLARATPGFSGADLFNMVNWAAIESIKKHKEKISMKFLDSALLNVAIGREKKSLVLSEESKRLCAFHEAGHAIVSLYTPGALKIRKATVIPRANALGMVTYLAEEDPLITKQQLLAKIDVSMGGRAAEALIYGDSALTQGASSDFSAATNIAWKMVTEFGMSGEIGPVSLKAIKEGLSPETQQLVEQEVKSILEEGLERAKRVLQKHKKDLNLVAEALLKYETLSLEEIDLVLKGGSLDYRFQEQLIEKEEDDRRMAAEELKRKKIEIELKKLREDYLVDSENEDAV